MSGPPPLSELLDALRDEGLRVGVDDHVRLRRLLACEAAWSVPKLKAALRALAAKDAEQIEVFDRVFDRFFQEPRAPEEETKEGGETKPPPPVFGWSRAAVVVAGFALVGLLAVLLRPVLFPRGPQPLVAGGSPSAQPSATATGPETAPSQTPSAGPITSAGPGAGGPVKPAPPSDLVSAGNRVGPGTSGQAAGSASAKPAAAVPTAASSAAAPQPTCDPPPEPPAYTGPLDLPPTPVAARARWAGVLGSSALALLGAGWILERRRRALRLRFVPGPARYRHEIAPREIAPALHPASIEAAASDLASPSREDLSSKLDVDRTVAATGAEAGYPRLVFVRSAASPRYAILVDAAPSAAAWQGIYEDMAARLRRAGVTVAEYAFERDPSLCRPARGEGPALPLSTLADRFDAVIFVGDGDGAIDPLDAAPAPWLTEIERIRRRLWLNPLPPARWSPGARAVAGRTPMAHGTSAGLSALMPGWVPDRPIDDDRVLAPVALRIPDSGVAVDGLRRHLGGAFPWLCMCAAAGEPSADLARWLYGRAGLDLPEADRLRLLTLPWFAEGRWPDGLAGRLAAALREEAPDLAARVHRDMLALLEGSEPEGGTLAHLRWRLDRAIHAARAGKDLDRDQVTELVESPLHAAAGPALAGLGYRSAAGVGAVALLVSGALAGAGAAGFAGAAAHGWYRGTEQTCANWTMVWGEPVCVGPLPDALRARREASHRFQYRRGRLVRMDRVNASGALSPTDGDMRYGSRDYDDRGVASWVPSYGGDGRVQWLDGLDRNGTLVKRLEYERRSEREWLVRFRDRSLALRHEGGTAVVGERWTLDDRGLLALAVHVDESERPRPLAKAAYGMRFVWNRSAGVDAVTYLAPAGRLPSGEVDAASPLAPHDTARGPALRRFTRDERGDAVQQLFFDACGRLAVDDDLTSGAIATRDACGNLVEAVWVGTLGDLTLNGDGYARFALTRDEHGNVVETAYRGLDGEPTPDKNGVARFTKRYDARGNVIEQRSFDARGNPTADKNGVARYTQGYDDRGNLVDLVNFGADDAPTLDKNGVGRMTQRYDDRGDLVEVAYFDTAGKPTLNKNGVARFTKRYDDRGDLVEVAYFDAAGKPAPSKDGYARFTQGYDDHGNLVRVAHFDEHGAPTLDKDGVAGFTRKYDERGNVAAVAYFGKGGAPTLGPEGVASLETKYDEWGKRVEEAYFDAGGKPMLHKDGYARLTEEHDMRGNVTERAFLDARGAPTLDKSGVARFTMKYDARGNMIEQANFDARGRLTLSKQGIARFTKRYDDRGNMVEQTSLDARGDLTLDKDGVARFTKRYDERDNAVEGAYFGTDGKPTLRKEGYARYTSRYDEHDLPVEVAHFDVDGALTVDENGVARCTKRYDERGNMIEQIDFDAKGSPAPDKDGVARFTRKYDERGGLIEQADFDAGGSPAPSNDGIARYTQRRDDRGNAVEVAYFDAAGKPVADKQGVARITRTYDEHGRLVEESYFDADARPVRLRTVFMGATLKYDDRGNKVEETYHVRLFLDFRVVSRFDARDDMIESEQGLFDSTGLLPRLRELARHDYDARDREIVTTYHDDDGRPVVGKDGYAVAARAYDDHDRVIEQTFYGLYGRLAMSRADHYARAVFEYDARGREIHRTTYDADGAEITRK